MTNSLIIGSIRILIYNEIFNSKRIKEELNQEFQKKAINANYEFIKNGGLDKCISFILTNVPTIEEMDMEIRGLITSSEDVIIRQCYSSELINKLFNK